MAHNSDAVLTLGYRGVPSLYVFIDASFATHTDMKSCFLYSRYRSSLQAHFRMGKTTKILYLRFLKKNQENPKIQYGALQNSATFSSVTVKIFCLIDLNEGGSPKCGGSSKISITELLFN